ncbi:hypothetical protein N7456_012823 [Penicillium angulare]|uniref:Uncharacterized protein n=1 Tax=Penicillium angulare TaxID=116970 RepID=A0A9W9EKJ2_9EURO|nr:hypothetical protein N7456_012823 [Penicillium angulare]
MGGPYAPRVAMLGGKPTIPVDVPICSVFLVLFLSAGAAHMTIFQRNRRRDHKFIPSAVTFGFCMSRVIANIIRIAWACNPMNVRLAIAAQIFVAAGILLLFILNLLYAQRMLRAAFPSFGWSAAVSWIFKGLYVLVVLTIIMMITTVIQSMYTLDVNIQRIDRDIQLYGVTYFAIVSFLPLPIVLAVLLFSRGKWIEEFGSGSWVTKVMIVTTASVLLCLGASFRAGTTWMPGRPASSPPWYDHKACFYVFDFGIDISVVLLFLFTRVDRRFWVPNGSSEVRTYYHDVAEEKNTAPAAVV